MAADSSTTMLYDYMLSEADRDYKSSPPWKPQPCITLNVISYLCFLLPVQQWTMQRLSIHYIFTLSFRSAVKTCCRIGLMYFNGRGLNLFYLRKSYKFCSSISNIKQVWFSCWRWRQQTPLKLCYTTTWCPKPIMTINLHHHENLNPV